MNALFTYWSAPVEMGYGHKWYSPYYERLAYRVSVALARRVFGKVILVTDTKGAEFMDRLRIDFDSVLLDLDSIPKNYAYIWSLGKLHAYSIQTEPFCSVDLDVMLWKKPDCVDCRMFAQSPERFNQEAVNKYHYKHYQVMHLIRYTDSVVVEGLKIPQFTAYNMGIFGGTDLESCCCYADNALCLAMNRQNQEGLMKLFEINQLCPSTFVEQWYLGAFAARFKKQVGTLFEKEWGPGGCFHKPTAFAKGYSHLLGDSKSKLATCQAFELRVRDLAPNIYEETLCLI